MTRPLRCILSLLLYAAIIVAVYLAPRFGH